MGRASTTSAQPKLRPLGRCPRSVLINHQAPNAVPQPPAPLSRGSSQTSPYPESSCPAEPSRPGGLSPHPQPGGISTPPQPSSPKPGGSINPLEKMWLRHGGHHRARECHRPPWKGDGAAPQRDRPRPQGCSGWDGWKNPARKRAGLDSTILLELAAEGIRRSTTRKPACGTVRHRNAEFATARGSPSLGLAPEDVSGSSEFYSSSGFSISGIACPNSSLLSPLKQWVWLFLGGIWLFPCDRNRLSASQEHCLL